MLTVAMASPTWSRRSQAKDGLEEAELGLNSGAGHRRHGRIGRNGPAKLYLPSTGRRKEATEGGGRSSFRRKGLEEASADGSEPAISGGAYLQPRRLGGGRSTDQHATVDEQIEVTAVFAKVEVNESLQN